MNKIFLIVQREYLTRVRKKSFLITTLILPLLFLGVNVGTAYLAKKTASKNHIAIQDTFNQFTEADFKTLNSENIVFEKTNNSAVEITKSYKEKGFTAYCILPKLQLDTVTKVIIQSSESKGDITNAEINAKLNYLWNSKKLETLGIDVAKKAKYEKSTIDVEIKNDKDPKSNGKLASGLARILGILIYMIILIYGSQVMMSVMEEKTSRIAEVIVSSVKPFQLMMGKLIGVGAVALTQFLLWIGLILVIFNVLKANGTTDGAGSDMISSLQTLFAGINIGYIILFFILYFIGGFFFYASIYAAIGSAVSDDPRDAQQLAFPITMLIIFSLVISTMTANDPSSGLATWTSFIPFCSPFVMVSRIPYGIPTTVPWWQLITSLIILYASIAVVIWLAAKIYRTGILMYGKKVTLKEMIKWIKRK